MKVDLEPTKNVLRAFLLEIESVKQIQQSISEPALAPMNIKDRSPDLSGVEFIPSSESFWVEDDAYIWI